MREPPLPNGRDFCLFLDIDGTLLEFAATPDSARVDEPLRALLRELERTCRGALALVSGRTIPDVDDLFEPLYLPVAGVHGCERRDGLGYWHRQASASPAFIECRELLARAVAHLDGVLVEDKGCAVALHYRKAPHLEKELRAIVDAFASRVPPSHAFFDGDQVIELKSKEPNKGSAIQSFMEEAPFCGCLPIFVGDDRTDRDGFEVVKARGGLAIAVGNNVESDWHLPDPRAVREWLARLAAARHGA
jgi:trehalose 6-phosphate phosphatase